MGFHGAGSDRCINPPVVLGGPHVSVLPAESVAKLQVDVVVRGEGEAVWVKLEQIADLLIEHQVNHGPWIFVNGIRANLATVPLLTRLKQAGLKRVAFGVESGDPDVLLSIDKKIDHGTIRQAFKNAKSAGLETIGFFIIGLPGEDEETKEKAELRESVEAGQI